ncbi:MAG: GAF domain-containing protein [Anaerolineales bacterium]|nr:GAF domain-containing protein [Anaerolineales bacterium]
MSFAQPEKKSQQGTDTRESLQTWRENVFASVINVVAIVGSIAYFAGVAIAFKTLTPAFLALYTGAYLIVLASTYLKKIPIIYRMGGFVFIIYAIGMITAVEKATVGDGRVWLLSAAVFAAIFLGRRAGISAIIFITVSWGLLGYLFNAQLLERPLIRQYAADIWAGTSVTLLIVGLILVITIAAILSNLNTTIQRSYALAAQADEQSNQLQAQSKTLERRSAFLEAASRVSHVVAPLLSPAEILDATVTHMVEEFDFNHVGIYIFDDTDGSLTLKAEAGAGDYKLPANTEYLEPGEDMAGAVIVTQNAYIWREGDDERDVRLKIALPNTRAQAALPIRENKGITGVLTLQSEQAQAFGDVTLSTLQILTDQIGMYLENARLLLDREEAILAQQRAYGDLTQAAWQEYAEMHNRSGYRRDKRGFAILETGEQHPPDEQANAERVPLMIRGRLIGYVSAKKPDGQNWTFREKELLTTLVSRLETIVDSARLYTETQQRAARERVIGDVTTRMRETLSINSVLETAARELRDALNIAEADVWIAPVQAADIAEMKTDE